MSNLLKCCCDCTSTRRVFRPCSTTSATTDVRAPVLTSTQFDDCGFYEGKVYHYQPGTGDCDDYCGTWVCLNIADDAANRCHPDDPSGCPSCADWDGIFRPPFREVRAAEMPAFCSKFSEVDSCCDDTVCPTTCEFGDVQTGDCSTCYDVNDLGWSVQASFFQDSAASGDYDGSATGCVHPVSDGTTVTTNAQVFLTDVSTHVFAPNTTTLVIIAKFRIDLTTSPDLSSVDGCDSGNQPCVGPCFYDDPDCADVPGPVTSYYRLIAVEVPCMIAPGLYACTNSPECDLPSLATLCGGVLGVATWQTAPGWSPVKTFGHAIGWGGNAECCVVETDVTWGLPAATFQSGTVTSGSGKLYLSVNLSLPVRPDDC